MLDFLETLAAHSERWPKNQIKSHQPSLLSRSRRMDSLAGQTMAPRWPLRLPAGGPVGLPVACDS